jgi:hypothetical protein
MLLQNLLCQLRFVHYHGQFLMHIIKDLIQFYIFFKLLQGANLFKFFQVNFSLIST